MDNIAKALEDLRNGRMVLVYDFDDRERETDMVVASEFITPDIIKTMRQDAGGLICTAVYGPDAEDLRLPFLADIFAKMNGIFPGLEALAPDDIPYDTKSAFSITINHRETYTGITDRDRALTIRELANLISSDIPAEEKQMEFGRHFRAPGHIHLLRTSDELLKNRKGHTEMSTALTLMAGLTPSATICEMMGDDGNAMSKEEVRKYAAKHDLAFIEGKELLKAWMNR